jgi:short-subunit dehydrogenase
MRARGRGTLVNVSSLAAEFPLPYMAGYNVAKAGLSALSESLLFESRGTAVKIVDFRPGDYRTAFNQTMQTPTSAASAAQTARAWAVLEANLAAAPVPARAAADLRGALLAGRRGIVRSGSFFQATLAPALARFAPASLLRGASARYFGS